MDLGRKKFEMEFAGKPLVIEVSRLAEQANAAVIGKYAGVEVLVTVVMGKENRKIDFFPLVVDYEERFYAAGKIIGSRYVRREGRASDDAILSGRIIDRTIRPLFNQKIRRDVQVVATILSIDEKNNPDFIALFSASVALAMSDIPWDGPVAGVEIMKNKTGEFLINPDLSVIEGGFDMLTFASGTEDRINMIELEGIESSEESALEAFKLAQEKIKELISWQKKIVSEIGKKKTNLVIPEENKKLVDEIRKFLSPKFESAIYTKDKTAREVNLAKLKNDLEDFLKTKDFTEEDLSQIEIIFEEQVDAEVHRNIIEKDLRPDFRKIDEVRELYSEVGLLPRTHGSAIFVRGNTQSLAITTLGAPNSEQMIETMQFTGKKRFLLHYNFPQYSVGEIGGFRGPGRREIGHGALASKALRNLIPAKEDFPYTIRVVSEILSSNGSSSMATVCAATLSLMDAGVPIKKPVAGIAMGLMSSESGKFKVITDLQGPEDHYGDMDFKVAGTRDGVTAMQLDVKINGLNYEMIKDTLVRAKKARMHILDSIEKTLAKPRENVSPNAPQIMTCAIPQDRIGEVIGPGGKMINGIIAETGVISIDIDQDGKVYITGPTKETVQSALSIVKSIVKEFVVGEIVEGNVVKILEFGAIVQLDANNDGMIHVSELKNGFVKNVADVLKVGDFVRAKIIKVEDGRIGLSLKAMTKDTA